MTHCKRLHTKKKIKVWGNMTNDDLMFRNIHSQWERRNDDAPTVNYVNMKEFAVVIVIRVLITSLPSPR